MYADMSELGQNPARIIPAWRDFVDAGDGQASPRRGIGEPIWVGRSDVELIECQRHESLLNVAFDEAPTWWLLCPYDTSAPRPDHHRRGAAQPSARVGRRPARS